MARLALLPVLALLLGALGLFAAAPAQAQTTVWSATLTVDLDADPRYRGCDNVAPAMDQCSMALTDDDFVFEGVTYQVNRLFVNSSNGRLTLEVDPDAGSNLAGLKLHLGTVQLTVGEDVRLSFGRALSFANSGVTWTDNQQVAVKLVLPPVSLGRAGSMSVDGFHPMGPGRMKIAEGTSITYGIVIHQPPTADLTITPRHHNVRPDGSDYPNVDNRLLTIHNAVTWKAAPHPNYLSGDWQRAKSVRLTAVDDNECKSPSGTRYWIRHHGSGGGPDWGGWDRQDRHHGLVISIEIIDDDCKYLARSAGTVQAGEGGSATYTVRLKTPLEDAAYIVPRISAAGDSDPGAITVSPERIRVEAGDTSPQTFTVSARRDADSRDAVLHVDHSVDSPEVPADYLGARVTVIVTDEQHAAREQERDALSVTGLALTAGSEAVALSPAFSTNVLSYRAEVPAGTTRVTLAPHWSGGESVFAGSRRGGTTFTRPARVRPSGTAVALALAPDGGATELWVMASGGSSGMTTYRIEVTEAQTQAQVPEEQTPPEEEAQTVAVAFSNVPPEHDGRTPFALDVQSGSKPAADAFKVTAGTVTGVESLDPVLWRVRVLPKSWKDVTVALGAASVTVRGPARIRVADARAKEGKDASLDFAVTLSRAASHEVTVDYATKDGTATAGADYTATSGTLTFAPGETAKTVSVALLDDAIDEGKEKFKLKLSNPQGAYLRAMHREAVGVIRNDDPIPAEWHARFGRTVTGQVLNAVEMRLWAPRQAGAQATLAGQAVPLAVASEQQGARTAGAAEWDGRSVPTRTVTERELLTGSSFALSGGVGDGGGLASLWGRGAISRFGGTEGDLTLDGTVMSGLVGADWATGRWTAGLAVGHSRGEGGYRSSAGDGGVEAAVTGLYPYAGLTLTEWLSVWAAAGHGIGEVAVTPEGKPKLTADLALTMGAAGLRSEVVRPPADGYGLALTLTGDARWTRTASAAVQDAQGGRMAAANADVWLARAGVAGAYRLAVGDGWALTPALEVGVRRDGGDAEQGVGADLGGGLALSVPQHGLALEVKGRALVTHEAAGFREWGASAALAWSPGAEPDRGPSLSLRQSWGATPAGGMDALLGRETLAGLAAGDAGRFEAASRLDGEIGYGLALGDRVTGTPNAGFGLTDGGARDYRIGWRLTSAAPAGDTGFEVNLDVTRREPADGAEPEHGVRLGGTIR